MNTIEGMTRAILKERGWTLRQAERETGVEQTTIFNLSHGKKVSPDMAAKFARAVGEDPVRWRALAAGIPEERIVPEGHVAVMPERILPDGFVAATPERVLADGLVAVPRERAAPPGHRIVTFPKRDGGDFPTLIPENAILPDI